MTTKRETILAAVTASLTSALPSAAVARNRHEAYAAGQAKAVVVRPLVDNPEFVGGVAGSPVNSRLSFAVDVMSVDTEAATDDVAETVYATVMAGIAGTMDVTPGAHSWEMDGANEDAIVLTMQFDVLYRHAWESLSA